jgi:chemotaxis-related protein WspD
MTEQRDAPRRLDRILDDCWNRIGVRGDGSCPELKQYVHCHNCPVFSAGAADMLDADAPDSYFADRTAHFAESAVVAQRATRSVVIFRVADEWLALPTSVVVEVANQQSIHSLPHRPSGIVLGLASVRGELLVCVSLGRIVGVDAIAAVKHARVVTAFRRMLVLRRDALRVACPVDAVHGIHRFPPSELTGVPSTVAKATVSYSTGLLRWQGHSVGTLDDELLFYTLRRSLG